MTSKEEREVQKRIVSILYSVIIISLTFYLSFIINVKNNEPLSGITKLTFAIGWGHYIYDLSVSISNNMLDHYILAHHVWSIITNFSMIIYSSYTSLSAITLFYYSFWIPFVHLRLSLKIVGLRYSLLFEVMEVAYVIGFFYSRTAALIITVRDIIYPGLIPLAQMIGVSFILLSASLVKPMIKILITSYKSYMGKFC